jgi:hypothetical protein
MRSVVISMKVVPDSFPWRRSPATATLFSAEESSWIRHRRGFYETAAEFKGFLMFFYSWDLLLLRLFLLSLTRS